MGVCGSVVLETLCYKSESLKVERSTRSRKIFLEGIEHGRCVGLTTLLPTVS
jgi:hypothetical protein